MQSEIEVDGLMWTSNASPVACLFKKYSDVFAEGYANLWQTSIERSTSIKRPLAGTPRVAA